LIFKLIEIITCFSKVLKLMVIFVGSLDLLLFVLHRRPFSSLFFGRFFSLAFSFLFSLFFFFLSFSYFSFG